MSWIRDLDELSPTVKSFLICMACLMPFWYISIFIFNPVLFNNHNTYLILSFSFCFSLLWYMVSLFLNFLAVLCFSKISNQDEDDVKAEEPVLLGGVDSIIYLCFAILICYISKTKYDVAHINYHFMSFLKLAFWFAVIRVIIVAGAATLIVVSENKKRQHNTPPADKQDLN